MPGNARSAVRWAGAVTVLAIGTAVVGTIQRTGRLGYALDDAYIHLAIAGTLADHGTFGIEPGHYESASSSPLWTGLLALGRLTPVPASWWPLLLGLPCALVVTWLLCRETGADPEASLFERSAVHLAPITVGVAPLLMTGMEHVAHVAVVLALLELATGTSTTRSWRRPVLLGVGTALRFETAFIAAGLAVLTVRRDGVSRRAARSIAADVAPVVGVVALVAAVNVSFGRHLLPSSIVAKAATGRSLVPDIGRAVGRLFEDPLLLGLVLVAAFAAARGRRCHLSSDAAVVVLVATGTHLLWADVGWFARYQAYLVAAGVFVGFRLLRELGRPAQRLALAALLVAAVGPRAVLLVQTPGAADDIHRIQEQVGRFLVAERPGEAVALNDIGFPAYLGAGPIIDLFGLADHRMLELRRSGDLDRASVAAVLGSEGAELMIIFERAFGDLVPERWQAVERWCYPDRVVVADRCITFFAAPAAVGELRAELERFATRLPAGVERHPTDAADGAGG